MDMPPDQPPAALVRPPISILKQRADFLRASRAAYKPMPAFVVQARKRPPDEAAQGIRVGFTCSKKVGNAVARNRAKRRLRETARLVLPTQGRDGWDYVLIGKRDTTAAHLFTALQSDLAAALAHLHK